MQNKILQSQKLNQPSSWCENQCAACKCKVPMIVGGVIFSLIMLVLGVYLGSSKKNSNILVTPTPIVSAPTIQPTAALNAATANWKTYKNEKYGFEFKYPENWSLNPNNTSPNSVSVNLEELNFSVNVNLQGFGMECFKDEGSITFLLGNENIEGNLFKGIDNGMCSQSQYYSILITKKINENQYLIGFGGKGQESDYNQLFSQILSTFKFTGK